MTVLVGKLAGQDSGLIVAKATAAPVPPAKLTLGVKLAGSGNPEASGSTASGGHWSID